MKRIPDEDMAEIERALRKRLDSIEVKPKVEEDRDDFWLGIVVGWVLGAVLAGAVILYFS